MTLSLNYVHEGHAKLWYNIKPKDLPRFIRHVKASRPCANTKGVKSCPNFLYHKFLIGHPESLLKVGIELNAVVQNAGELIMTFPEGAHGGFNFGPNLAEAQNFVDSDWVQKEGQHRQTFAACAHDVDLQYVPWLDQPLTRQTCRFL